MADHAQSRHLDELINDINFPLPDGDMLDLDFDFESSDFLDEALGLQDTPMESLLDQQYGAVAALATQVCVSLAPSLKGLCLAHLACWDSDLLTIH